MKKFVKLLVALLVIVPCLITMVACDTVSAAERPTWSDTPAVDSPLPEEPVEDDPTVDPEPAPEVDEYVKVNNQAELVAAIAATQPGDFLYVRLTNDIVVSSTIVINRNVTLNLNGHNLVNNQAIKQDNGRDWSLISVRDNGSLTVDGEGVLQTRPNDCYAIDLQAENARLTINGGTYIGNISAIYIQAGRCTINGGYFKVQQTLEGAQAYDYVVDCADENFDIDVVDGKNNQIGAARLWVYGGQFENYNPAQSHAEKDKKDKKEEYDYDNMNFAMGDFKITQVIYEEKQEDGTTLLKMIANPTAAEINEIKNYPLVKIVYQINA